MSTWDNYEKSGASNAGWSYAEANLTYASLTNPDTGAKVYYAKTGSAQTVTNQIKH